MARANQHAPLKKHTGITATVAWNNLSMRLNPDQIQVIQSVVHKFAGSEATGWLLGSRLDDSRRGGDVDQLVQSSPQTGLLQRACIKNQLEFQPGLPVDELSAANEGAFAPFVRIAMAQGVRL